MRIDTTMGRVGNSGNKMPNPSIAEDIEIGGVMNPSAIKAEQPMRVAIMGHLAGWAPREGAHHAAVDERPPVHLLDAGRVALLHGEPEEDHPDVRAEDGDERRQLIDAADERDEHDHQRRAHRVLPPAQRVGAAPEVGDVPALRAGQGADEVVGRRQEQEDGDEGGQRHLPHGLGAQHGAAGRPHHVGDRHAQREPVGQQEHRHALRRVQDRQGDVPAAQVRCGRGGDHAVTIPLRPQGARRRHVNPKRASALGQA